MGQRPRKGFRAIRADPDWFVEGNRLVWNQSQQDRQSVEISRLAVLQDYFPKYQTTPPHQFGARDAKLLLSAVRSKRKSDPNALDDLKLLTACDDLDVNKYINAGMIILPSPYWSDAQKLFFLVLKISEIQGFTHGKDVQSMLSRIQWHDSHFTIRMNGLYELLQRAETLSLINRLGGYNPMEIDRAISNNLRGDVTIYRGFNVPTAKSVRDRNVMKMWFRQETGRGVYFTLSSQQALHFACLQKSSFASRLSQGESLKSEELKILGGKIAVAKYKIPIDKIILYQHAIARFESECICKPSDTLLVSYNFYGFDNLIDTLNSFNELQHKIQDEVELIRELAFAQIPKRKRGRRA